MESRFRISRRRLLGAAFAAPFVSRPAFGRAGEEGVIMANFGGGVAEEFDKAYGKPFTAETGIAFRVVEVPSTETALISTASDPQYDSSYHSYSGAMRLHKLGVTEPMAVSDYPALQEIPLNAGVAQYKAVVENALTSYTSMAQNHQLLQRGEAVACAYY
ncbi:hypothetical protein AB4144_18200, partial [Rhizobiaceae sp. 2RAB30]